MARSRPRDPDAGPESRRHLAGLPDHSRSFRSRGRSPVRALSHNRSGAPDPRGEPFAARAPLESRGARAAAVGLARPRLYAEFTRAERISPQGLVDASLEAPAEVDTSPERALFAARLRDGHDLWHVVTGYGRDLLGEAALLAFTYRQTGNPGIGLIVLTAWWKAGRDLPGSRALILDGYRRAGTAAWLPAVDWESLLEWPLEEVRRTLRITPVEAYTAVRSARAPRLA